MQNSVGAAQASTHCRLNLCSTHHHHEPWEPRATVFVLQLFHGCSNPFTRTTAESMEGTLPYEEDTKPFQPHSALPQAKCPEREGRNLCGYDGRLGEDFEGTRLWGRSSCPYLCMRTPLVGCQLSANAWVFVNPNICQGSGA